MKQAGPHYAVHRAAGVICLLAGLGFTSHYACQAAAEPALEYRVKAAFLLNFTKFIEWPAVESAGADSASAICIMGEDPFDGVLDQLVEGETLNSRKIVVQRVRRPPPGSCRILFVAKSEKDVAPVLAALGPGMLTVGEDPGFLRDGGMIAFVVENGRVRFDIAPGVAAKAGLKMSSRLLSVARSVTR